MASVIKDQATFSVEYPPSGRIPEVKKQRNIRTKYKKRRPDICQMCSTLLKTTCDRKKKNLRLFDLKKRIIKTVYPVTGGQPQTKQKKGQPFCYRYLTMRVTVPDSSCSPVGCS